MVKITTQRLVGLSDMEISEGKLKPINASDQAVDLFNLQPKTGRESGFLFYGIDSDYNDQICHIGITWQRGKFEVSYGTEKAYQRKGYMCEALSSFLDWIKHNTLEHEVWGLPNCSESEHILLKSGFTYFGNLENTKSKWYRYIICREV